MPLRSRLPWLFPLFLLSCVSLAGPRTGEPSVTFVVDAREPAKGTIDITMTFHNVPADHLILTIPVWMPGAYRVLDFGKDIQGIQARDGNGKALNVTAMRMKNVWMIDSKGSPDVTVTYRRTMTKDNFDTEHCFLQGPATFLYAKESMNVLHRVQFLVPDGWKIATGLDPVEGSNPLTYAARDYDTFVDAPVEIGKFTLKEFTYKDALYQVVIDGPTNFNLDAFVETVRKIVAWQVDFFQDTPYARYVFIYHVDRPGHGGGLEHLNSTTISLDAERLRTGDFTYHAAITAHEFFHLWNVKRIRPKVLGPFNYSGPVRTKALWFCEGVTDYYAHMSLARSGLWTEDQLLKDLSREISSLLNNEDRKATSIEQASWTAWDSHDGPRVSYYTKGLLLGLLLDLQIRKKTGHNKSLDDVMIFLHRWFVKESADPIGEGFEERDLKRAVHAVSGHDFSEFFARYVSGTDELPLEEALKELGYELAANKENIPWIGTHRYGTYIFGTSKGSPAEAAGFKYGDRIVAVNGKEVDRAKIDEELKLFKAGDELTLKVRRGEEFHEGKVKVSTKEVLKCSITPMEKIAAEQEQLRRAWLTGKR